MMISLWKTLRPVLAILTCVALSASTPSTADAADAADAGKKKMRVFLLAGQSNMGGGNYIGKPRDNNPGPDAIWYRVSHIEAAAKPDDDKWTWLENIVPNTKHGCEAQFAYRMQTLFPQDRIAIVKCYRNGAGIGLWTGPQDSGLRGWQFTSDRMDAVKQDLDARVQSGEIADWNWEGFVWMQGESDAAFRSQPIFSRDYDKSLQRLVALVRAKTGNPDLPAVIGRIYAYANRGQMNIPGGWRQLLNVRWGQERAPLDFAPAAWVDLDNLAWKDDDAHCQDYTEMGVRFGQAMANLLAGKTMPQRPFRPTVTWTKNGTSRLHLDVTDPKADPWCDEHEYEVAEAPGLGVTAGDGQVTLDWDYAQDADSYTVRWGADPKSLDQSKAGIKENQFTITGLKNDVPIHAVVVSVNAAGESLPSRQISATPSAKPTAPLWVWLYDLKRYPEARVLAAVGEAVALEATVRGPRLDTTTFRWEQVEGPAKAAIADPAAMDTTITCPQPGSYLLRFTASEGSATASRDLELRVEVPKPNTAPTFQVIRAADGAVGEDILLDVDVGTEDLFPRMTPRKAVWRVASGPEGAQVAGLPKQRYLGMMRANAPGRYRVEAVLDDGELSTTVPFTVDVYPAGWANLAVGRAARQSSLGYPQTVATCAVDRMEGKDTTLSKTKKESQPWWEVDLGAEQAVERVMVLPRTASVNKVCVFVLDQPYDGKGKPVWQSEPLTITPLTFIDLEPKAKGRYVAVVGQGDGQLVLTEVRVIGPGKSIQADVPKTATDE